jgi:hypothetical protein
MPTIDVFTHFMPPRYLDAFRETLQVIRALDLTPDAFMKIHEGNARRLMPNLRP